MATKKCPKCGEENPAEAVMCWACYTPLAGGAAAVAGGGLVTPRGGAAAVTPAATAAHQNDEKAATDPKVFLVAGLLVGAMIIGGFTTGIIPGLLGGKSEAPVPLQEDTGGGGGQDEGFSNPLPPVQQPPALTMPAPGGGGGAAVTPPSQESPFKTVVPPDPRYANGTMGIMATAPNISPATARSLAKYAKQQFAAGGKWTAMQVVVFSDPGAAGAFRKYQAQRRGAKLTPREYQDLASQGVWASVPAFYETKGKNEQTFQPSANPNGWWTGKPLR